MGSAASAASAAVVIQRYARRFLARRLLGQLRHQRKQTELAAAEYLNNVHFHRVKSDRNSDHGILRRSWLDPKDPHHRGPGSFSLETGHFVSDAHGTMRLRESFAHRRSSNANGSENRANPKGIDYSLLEDSLVYPFIGFVIKGKLENSGRKVFINLCHSPHVLRAAASPMRLWTEEKHHDDDGEVIVEEVIVLDVVMPSSDFNDHFVYKDTVGLVPINSQVRDQLGDLCIMLINGMDQCPDPRHPPIASLTSPEDYRLSPHTSWPRIKRGYVGCLFPMVYEPSEPSLQYCPPFRLNKDVAPVTTQVMAAMCPPEVRAWMSLSLKAVDEKDVVPLSTIARIGQTSRGWDLSNDGRSETGAEDDLESHQKMYIRSVRRIKEGVRVFVVLYHGMLSFYVAASSSPTTAAVNGASSNNSPEEDSCLSLPFPYGRQELIRLVLSSLDIDISIDLANDLYNLNLDFMDEERESLFVLSKCLNVIATTSVNPRKLCLQFRNYSELMTWKMIFEEHRCYAQYAMAKYVALVPSLRFHGVSMASMPSSRTMWLVERQGPPRRRRRVFVKVDRGWFIIFPNDNSITPSLSNALEIFSLASVRCEVAHRRIIRMRKWMTRITLLDDDNGWKRDFYLRSNDGELDADIKAILAAVGSNISYAHSQFYRYLIPWLDDNDVLGETSPPLSPMPTSTTASTASTPASMVSSLISPAIRSTILHCVGCSLEVQILTPEPQTSDDDSDVDDPLEGDETAVGCAFRLLRPKAQGSGILPSTSQNQSSSSSTSASTTRARSTAPFASSSSGGGTAASSHHPELHARYQEVADKLQEAFPSFVSAYFPCRLLLYQDLHLLLFLHLNRLVAVINFSRCIEKTMAGRKAKRGTTTPVKNRALDSSLYTIASSDEDDDENSDRDYFEDVMLGGEDRAAGMSGSWIIQLHGYDGRVYRLKFSNTTEYTDWAKTFLSRCVSPSSVAGGSDKTSLSRSAKFSPSDSTKGSAPAFDFVKECALSAPEWTFSASSSSSSSSLHPFSQPSLSSSSLLTSMLSGVGKSLSLSNGLSPSLPSSSEDPAWEGTIDAEATKKYNRSLRVSEKVIAAGIVLKHEKTVSTASAASAPKQKRVLLVTDIPRMMFIDTIGNIARGSIDMTGENKVEVRELDGGDFEVVVGGHAHRFTPQDTAEKDAKYWSRVIRYAISRL